MHSVDGGRARRALVTRAISAGLAVAALALGVVGAQQAAQAQDVPPAQANLNVQLMMAEGHTYDHTTGGGRWGDGPGGAPDDVWAEQQWPPTFACGDVVSFLLLVTSDSFTGVDPAPRTVEVDLRFAAATSGEPGAGYREVLAAAAQPDDPATMGDRQSTASLVGQQLDGLFTPGGTLTGTIRIDDVEVGDRVVTRVDVRADCSTEVPHTGILYAQLDQLGLGQSGFREVAPDGPRDLGAGQNRVQMVQVVGDPLAPAQPPPTTTPPTTTPTAPGDDGGSSTTTTTGPGVGGGGQPGVTLDKQPGTLVDLDLSGTATVGDRLDYQLVVTNVGDGPLTGVVVVDPKPGTTTPVCPGLVGGALAEGASVTCTVSYTLTADDLTAGQVVNSATVDTNETPPVSDTAVTPLATGSTTTQTTVLFVASIIPQTGVSVLPSGPMSLPRTGADTMRSVWWAAAFITAGLSLVTAATGRRRLHDVS